MITGKNIVVMKGDKKAGTETKIVEYDRVYLEFPATVKDDKGNDVPFPMEDYKKTSDGKELPNTLTKPKADITIPTDTDSVAALMQEALNYFQEQYPGSAEKPNDPYLVLLEAASYGADLWKRNSIQSSERPTKPLDRDKALEKMVKLVMAMKPGISADKAKLLASTLMEEEEPVAQ